jgi:hypothetical protein
MILHRILVLLQFQSDIAARVVRTAFSFSWPLNRWFSVKRLSASSSLENFDVSWESSKLTVNSITQNETNRFEP